MTSGTQRGSTVSPQNQEPSTKLCPIEEESDASQVGKAGVVCPLGGVGGGGIVPRFGFGQIRNAVRVQLVC